LIVSASKLVVVAAVAGAARSTSMRAGIVQRNKGLGMGARLHRRRRSVDEERAEEKRAACNRFLQATQARWARLLESRLQPGWETTQAVLDAA
jgi:hypothetical protein